MKIYLVTSYGYGFLSFHGLLTEERYKKVKKVLNKKAVRVNEFDTETDKVDLRKLPNKR